MPIKAILFDVFGTCVDWRSTVEAELIKTCTEKAILPVKIKAEVIPGFAAEWRAGYSAFCQGFAKGGIEEYKKIDVVHREILNQLLYKYHIHDCFSEHELVDLNLVWHRLVPWSDTVEGLTKLKERFIVGTLSNGNVKLLVDMAKNGKMPWDVIISGEMFGTTKPNKKIYNGAAEMLDLKPEEVMLCAAHLNDLKAAKDCGYATAYIPRPMEEAGRDPQEENYVDHVIKRISDLDTLVV